MTIDTDHSTVWEEVDSVLLHGVSASSRPGSAALAPVDRTTVAKGPLLSVVPPPNGAAVDSAWAAQAPLSAKRLRPFDLIEREEHRMLPGTTSVNVVAVKAERDHSREFDLPARISLVDRLLGDDEALEELFDPL